MTVREVVTSRLDAAQVREVLHVYVRGLGEVERRVFLRLTSTERQTLVEARLVGVDGPMPAR